MGIYTGVLYPPVSPVRLGFMKPVGTRITGIKVGRIIENGMTVDTLLVVVRT